MTFHSILFERTEDGIKEETLEAPAFFVNLNLDQIIDAITAGKQEYDLKPFFTLPGMMSPRSSTVMKSYRTLKIKFCLRTSRHLRKK